MGFHSETWDQLLEDPAPKYDIWATELTRQHTEPLSVSMNIPFKSHEKTNTPSAAEIGERCGIPGLMTCHLKTNRSGKAVHFFRAWLLAAWELGMHRLFCKLHWLTGLFVLSAWAALKPTLRKHKVQGVGQGESKIRICKQTNEISANSNSTLCYKKLVTYFVNLGCPYNITGLLLLSAGASGS